nr:MAG TPA: helix-turn-helix domain protein [Caudoviricetes sp.]
MNSRIKQIRLAKKETQAAFAAELGLSRNYIALMETGERTPSDRTIRDICQKYGVDEVWLRTGVGEMFRPRTREDEITAFFADLLSPDATDFQRDFVAILATLSPEGWDLMEKKLNELAELSRRRQENEK